MPRPDILLPLFLPVSRIKGVGKHLEACFSRLFRKENPACKDVLFHLPVSVVDRRAAPPLHAVREPVVATYEVRVEEHQPPPRRGKPYRVICRHASGMLVVTFFRAKGDYVASALPTGSTRIVSGRVERFGHEMHMPHPDYIVTPEERWKVERVEPVYPLTAGLSGRQLERIAREVLRQAPGLVEWIEPAFLKKQHWPAWKEAIHKAHHPASMEEVENSPARNRLAYDELLANQLALALARRHMRHQTGSVIPSGSELRGQMEKALPFQLTQGQQAVLRDVAADMASGSRMLRLLQGDVGSGKTVVAMLAMADVIAQGKQATLMAPTDILARQHAALFQRVLEPLGVCVVLLTGKTGTAKEREALRARVAAGEVDITIGTHALFQESTQFNDLALVVVDEQHRFGVAQRMQLAEKAKTPPHILLMTATPIPRTLTMTAFGDMDSSVLSEKPAGRQPVDTRALPLERLDEVVNSLHRALVAGNRIYWICPLVEENMDVPENLKSDLAAAEERYQTFCGIFGAEQVGMVHGRMKPEEREPVMAAFARGDYRILVATTVVEVGVDVPEATVMVIEHAERFGLSQLHQLRGRVGRGSRKSSCVLLYHHPCGEIGEQRLRIMRETEDGFRIAEEDMRLRGAGDVLGVRQSGMPDFHFADLMRHRELVLAARDDVKLILHRDTELQSDRGKALRILLYLFSYDENIRFIRSG